jgi:hypothetical protein
MLIYNIRDKEHKNLRSIKILLYMLFALVFMSLRGKWLIHNKKLYTASIIFLSNSNTLLKCIICSLNSLTLAYKF